MPDPLHHDALGGAGKFLEACVTILAFGPTEFHLDEFMVIERAPGLGDHGRGYPMLADEDDGVERMTQAAQIPALTFGEFHGPIVKIAAAARGLKPKDAGLIKPSQGAKVFVESWNPCTDPSPTCVSPIPMPPGRQF